MNSRFWLVLLALLSFSIEAENIKSPCESYQGTWSYKGLEKDGFELLKMTLQCDSSSPLPTDYLEWAAGKKMPLRGYIHFDVDGYEMGPFPFAGLEGVSERILTHYFYTQSGVSGYQFEDFEILGSEDRLVLWDMEECESGPCEVKYSFTRLR